MTIEESNKVKALTKTLFPDAVFAAGQRGRLGEAKLNELHWRVYNALIKVELI